MAPLFLTVDFVTAGLKLLLQVVLIVCLPLWELGSPFQYKPLTEQMMNGPLQHK